jgi:mRNA-degrading endonuclease toxin of MazEF toxin-antitoxin module
MRHLKSISMPSDQSKTLTAPRRGEIWVARLQEQQPRHWVLVVSINQRNLSPNALTVLIVPFASRLAETPTTIVLPPGETGLPGPSCLRGHFITTLPKSLLIESTQRSLSTVRMRQISTLIRRAFDPEAL